MRLEVEAGQGRAVREEQQAADRGLDDGVMHDGLVHGRSFVPGEVRHEDIPGRTRAGKLSGDSGRRACACRPPGAPRPLRAAGPRARRRAAPGSGRRSRARARSRGSAGRSFLATTSVVPLPAKGSRTTSPGFEQARMIRPRSCSGIWQPCQPARSLKVPQTRGKYQVSPSGAKPSGTSCGRRIQVSSGSRPLGSARRVGVDQLPRRGDADRLVVEGELLRVLHEVEQVGVAAG